MYIFISQKILNSKKNKSKKNLYKTCRLKKNKICILNIIFYNNIIIYKICNFFECVLH
jgi:hypothetical protein